MRTKILIFCSLIAGCSESNHSSTFDGKTVSYPFNHKRSSTGQGKYDKFLKVGRWVYGEQTSDTIFWEVFRDTNLDLELSYPANWIIEKSNESGFFCSKPNTDDYIVFLRHSTDEPQLDLISYQQIVRQKLVQMQDSILGHRAIEMSHQGNGAILSVYQLKSSGKSFIIMSFYTEIGDNLYDVTCKFDANQNVGRNELIFWDFVFNLRIDNANLVDKNKLRISVNEETSPR